MTARAAVGAILVVLTGGSAARADPIDTGFSLRLGYGVAAPPFHFGNATRIYQQPPYGTEQRMHGAAAAAALEVMPRPSFAASLELGVIKLNRPRAVSQRVGAYYVHDRFRVGGGAGLFQLQVSQEQEYDSDELTRWGPLVFVGGDILIRQVDTARVVLTVQLDAARLCQPAGGSCWFFGPRRRRALVWNIYTATAAVGLRW